MVRRFVARVTAAGVRLDHVESSRAHDRVLPPLLVHNDSTCELLAPQPTPFSFRGEPTPSPHLHLSLSLSLCAPTNVSLMADVCTCACAFAEWQSDESACVCFGVLGVVRLLNRSAVLLISEQEPAAHIGTAVVHRVTRVRTVLSQPYAATDLNGFETRAQRHFLAALQHFCDGHRFFHSDAYDLTLSAQAQARAAPNGCFPYCDTRAPHRPQFFWNCALSQPLFRGHVCCCCCFPPLFFFFFLLWAPAPLHLAALWTQCEDYVCPVIDGCEWPTTPSHCHMRSSQVGFQWSTRRARASARTGGPWR